MKSATLSLFFFWAFVSGCNSKSGDFFEDTPFDQEYHVAFPLKLAGGLELHGKEVVSIAVSADQTVWIATPVGVFRKEPAADVWTPVFAGETTAAYKVASDSAGNIWVGRWDGLYRITTSGLPEKLSGPQGPVAAIKIGSGSVFAAGPNGVWRSSGKGFRKLQGNFPRSVRDIELDPTGGVWLGSDVGLFHWSKDTLLHYYDTNELISGYVKGLATDAGGLLWVGGMGGLTLRSTEGKERALGTKNGLPSVFVSTVRRAPDRLMWVGTANGVVRFNEDEKASLLFSRRWLLDDQVNDIAFDRNGDAWVATKGGVSQIKKRKMTLAGKSDFFYDKLIRRHIRAPWIAGQAHLPMAGDTTVWRPEDDDNDGEYTGNYLAMESFRFAATRSKQAKENARKAFGFLKMLREITGREGFFARTVVPSDWKTVHDANRRYTDEEIADELVKEPRFKPVTTRWHLSADGRWLWKGDTSSDEMCGHMFGYYFYYTLVAGTEEKKLVAGHVASIVDHLMKHNYNLVDVDGTPTRWSVWSPDQLNRDPEWLPDRNQNSMEILAFLKLAYFMTRNQKYQDEYIRLIEKEKYLDNMSRVTKQNPAWFIYFDVILQAYLYPILLGAEKDEKLLRFYRNHMDRWFDLRRGDENPLVNFLYNYCRGNREELEKSIGFLKDTPLDLVDWPVDHSIREDVQIVRTPVLEELQVSKLPPASIRMTVRWDKNPWTLKGGNPQVEREPVFWLLPYWMGRYQKLISDDAGGR